MAGRAGIKHAIEPLIVVCSILAYLIAISYDSVAVEYPFVPALAMQIAIGIALVYVLAGIIVALWGPTSRNGEAHETAQILRLVAYPVLAIVLLHTMKVSIASLLVGAGFLGIVVGLATQSTLGNIFAGLSMLYSRPFKAGDKITFMPLYYSIQAPTYMHEPMFSEITGTVKSIGVIYTRLMKDDHILMYIPNSAMNQGLLQNHSRISERSIRVRLDVPRETDIGEFRKALHARLSGSEHSRYMEKLMDLTTKISLISSEQSMGIIINARVKVLDYDEVSQWLSENAIKALLDVKRSRR